MSEKKPESEQVDTGKTAVPILRDGIGTRIKAAADRIGSRKKAAKAAGVSDDMLYKYIREVSSPSFAAMVGLCTKAGLSLDWMATGEGEPEQGDTANAQHTHSLTPDFDALEEVVTRLRKLLREHKVSLRPEAEARIVRLIYEYYLTQGKAMDDAALNNVIEMAAFR